MVDVISVATGLFWGVWAACLWGLRKAEAGRPKRLARCLAFSPVVYFWGAEIFGWPTPGSIAESFGLPTEPVERVPFASTMVVTAVLAAVVLVGLGLTRPLERWSRKPE